MTAKSTQRLILALVLVGVLALNVVGTRNTFTLPFPGHNDFLNPVTATHAFYMDGLSPYGQPATDRIWEKMFGGPPPEGQDPQYFAYPFYATLMLVPFINIPYDWASAMWMVALEVCLVGALFLLLDFYKYRPRPLMLAALVLFSLLFYPAARGLILGQMSHVGYLLQALVLWALAKDRDGLAGVALALATYKPQMVYILVPLLLLWGLAERRWRFLAAFGVTFGLLVLYAFVVFPPWLAEWTHRLSLYPNYTLGSPVWIITRLYLGLGQWAEWVVNGALYASALWAWYSVIVERRHERFVWAIVWTLMVTHVAAPRTAAPHFVLYIIPLLFYFKQWQRTRPRQAGLWTGVTLLLFLIVPWAHFVLTVGGTVREAEHPTTHLLLPLLMLGLVWFTRRQWWSAPPLIAARRPQPVLETA
jgi:hypothetical protein